MRDETAGLFPLYKFGATLSDDSILLDSIFWGRPTYIFDPKFQDGNKLTKWKVRKRRFQFLGWY